MECGRDRLRIQAETERQPIDQESRAVLVWRGLAGSAALLSGEPSNCAPILNEQFSRYGRSVAEEFACRPGVAAVKHAGARSSCVYDSASSQSPARNRVLGAKARELPETDLQMNQGPAREAPFPNAVFAAWQEPMVIHAEVLAKLKPHLIKRAEPAARRLQISCDPLPRQVSELEVALAALVSTAIRDSRWWWWPIAALWRRTSDGLGPRESPASLLQLPERQGAFKQPPSERLPMQTSGSYLLVLDHTTIGSMFMNGLLASAPRSNASRSGEWSHRVVPTREGPYILQQLQQKTKRVIAAILEEASDGEIPNNLAQQTESRPQAFGASHGRSFNDYGPPQGPPS